MFRELQYQQWLYDIFKERTWYKNLIGLYTKKKLVLLVENIWKEEAKKNFGRLTLDFTKSVVNLRWKWGFYQEILHSTFYKAALQWQILTCSKEIKRAYSCKSSGYICISIYILASSTLCSLQKQTQNSDFQIQMKNWEIDQ